MNYTLSMFPEAGTTKATPHWIVDKTQNPKILTFKRLDGTTLTSFQVTEDSSSAARTKVG